MIEIIHGDNADIFPTLEPHSFDALITDPPYASGGAYRADRVQSTSTKYLTSDSKSDYKDLDFEGDQLDQRLWMQWTTEWLRSCRKLVRPGGAFALFIDWRQLAALTDCLSMAGWIVRGIAAWDKLNARPQPGRPRQQIEFIVWGSNGPLDINRDAPILPGIFQFASVPTGDRQHQAEKPVPLMREVVKICERGGRILDPFAGSSSTLVAAEIEGFDAIGIEVTEHYAGISKRRVAEVTTPLADWPEFQTS